VGTSRLVFGDRTAQAFYPTMSTPSRIGLEQLEEDPERTRYADLLAAAGACPTRQVEVAIEGIPSPGPFPFVVASHCHSCTRLSNASTAIRLASHGFVVVAPDHGGDTLWDSLDGNEGSLDAAQLAARVADLQAVLDLQSPVLSSADRTSIGVFGHSFGAVTAGRLAQLDDRIAAAAALAAPMENPLIPGVELDELDMPLLFLVAQEDNSITELGNQFIRTNYREAQLAAWKLEIADAGHWSVSDLVGLVAGFAPGCGADERQTDGAPFTYLDPATGRAITASYVTAFFRATMNNDPGARAYLDADFSDDVVSVEHHE
jgi:dienelactone hydrolase